MRGLDSTKFEQKLITGYCADNEADYLETVATDVKATRIAGLGRSISLAADAKAFIALVAMIKREKPDVIHTHTAKAGVLGRLAAILAGGDALTVHTFHGHLLHGYFSGWKTKLVIAIVIVIVFLQYSFHSHGLIHAFLPFFLRIAVFCNTATHI